MALRNLIGLGLGRPPAGSSGLTVDADAGSSTGWRGRCTSGNASVQLGSVAFADRMFFGGWFYLPSAIAGTSNNGAVAIRRGTAEYLVFSNTSSGGQVDVYVATSPTTGSGASQGSFTPPQDQWFHMEVEWESANSGGHFRLRIDGALVLSNDGDTQASSGAGDTRTLLLDSQSGDSWRFHSLYLADDTGATHNTALGTAVVVARPPASSGTSDFIGSDADSVDNHLLVDDSPAAQANTTDYIESAVVGHVQDFGMTALGVTGTVHGVKVTAWAVDNLAVGQDVDIGLESNATESVSTVALPTSDGEISHLIPLDPDGAAAWDVAAVDAAPVRLRVA